MNIRIIRIDSCVHLRGFRYGGFGNNIYEDYISGLASYADVNYLKEQFIDRIAGCRNRHFAEALGIQLEKKYPAWVFPWDFQSAFCSYKKFWTPEGNPDIVCHYSPSGMLASHLNREFFWLHRAKNSIISGYQPETFGYVRVIQLTMKGIFRYIVVDGNHRIASLHALGHQNVEVEIITPRLGSLSCARLWPGVVLGLYSLRDAQSIFKRYFFDENLNLPVRRLRRIIYDEPLSFN